MKKRIVVSFLMVAMAHMAPVAAQEPSGSARIATALSSLETTARLFVCEPRAIEIGEQAMRIATDLDRAMRGRDTLSELDETLFAEFRLRIDELHIDDDALAEIASLEVAGQYVDALATIDRNLAGFGQSIPALEAALARVRTALTVHNATCGRVPTDIPDFVQSASPVVSFGEMGPVSPEVAAARQALLQRARSVSSGANDELPAEGSGAR